MGTNIEGVRVVARLSRAFETCLGEESMTLPQFRLLAFLAEGEWAASVIADWLAVSRPSITALVDGLEEKGWVTREHSPSDRRRVLHRLTDAGHEQLATAAGRLESVLDSLFAHLEDGERDRVLEAFSSLETAMQRQREAVVRS